VLNKTSGVEHATVNLTTEKAMIEYNPNMIDKKGLIDKIGNIRYGANKKRSNEAKISHKDQELKTMKWKVNIAAMLTALLLVTMLDHLFGVYLPDIFMNPWFQLAFATPVQFILGWQFYRGAYKNLKNFTANMDVLVVMGTTA